MPGEDDVVPMVMCPQCEHLVPETNIVVHEARCPGRKRPARETESSENDDSSEQEDLPRRHNHRNTRRHRNPEHEPFLPRASWEARTNGDRDGFNSGDSDDANSHTYSDDSTSDEEEIISPAVAAAATAIPPSTATAAAASSRHEVIDLIGDEDSEEHWSCPRCTLENPVSTGQCEACSYPRPGSQRPPDPVRRERLVGGPQPNGSPGGLIGASALLGGLLGGGVAYSRGQPLSSGLFNGVLSGAMGGALLNELARNDPRQQVHTQTQQQSVFTSTNGGTSQSISVVRTPDGRTVVTQTGGGSPALNPNAMNDELNRLLYSLLTQRQQGVVRAQPHNLDQMSYEQLLQVFGTGTENLGAGEGQIRSLPSATIEDVDKLPVDSRQCAICLEDFKRGDERKIMPCLHGFHADCVDKWLRTNGSCPICKHRLER